MLCTAANVMIHENGSLQLIDFGVAGILQSKMEKRSTIIGTPHWMPPELHKNAPLGGLKYGTEVSGTLGVVVEEVRLLRLTRLTFGRSAAR